MLEAVGLDPSTGSTLVVTDDVAELCRRRDAARAARDWASADAIRDELTALGLVVEDTPEGTAVREA
jgi:cysteinyl-tRNA synthetase